MILQPAHARRPRDRRARHRAQAARHAGHRALVGAAPRRRHRRGAARARLFDGRHRRAARQKGGRMTHTIAASGTAPAGASTCRKSARATACRSKRPSCRPRTRSRWSTRCRRPAWRRSRSRPSCRRKAIPALRDAEVVLREIERKPGVVYTALVPNVRGAERAIDARADELNLVMSASESHNLANLRMTREQSFAGAGRGGGAGARRPSVAVNVSLSCSFGCPMEGDVPVDDGARLVRALRRRDGRARRHAVRHHRHGVSRRRWRR